MFERFTSRKFLAAVVGGTIAVLAGADVIDPTQQQETIATLTPIVYILVEGLLDFKNGRS